MKIIEFSFDADVVKTYHKIKKDRKIKEGDFIIEGYVMTSDIDSQYTIITNEAIKKSKNDLLKYSTVLFNHDMDRPIGKVLETDFDKKGLWIKMKLSESETEIQKKVQEGIISKFSIKGRVLKEAAEDEKSGEESDSEEKIPSGKEHIRKITRIELYEASLVSVPANVEAKTINWYIAKALGPIKVEKSNNKIKNTMIKQKVIKKVLKKKGMITELEELAGKLKKEESKGVVNKAIDALKKANKYNYKHTKKVLGLSDKSENVYEFNSTDAIELDGNKFRKQVLKTGEWYHWDANGGILTIDKNSVDSLVKNFKEKTIEHVYVPLTHTSDPIRNAGEVIDLIPTKNGLDAICEIKDDKVSKKIRDGLIKCVSVSIDENYMKKDTGEYVGPTLLHTALVAEPYIKGMSGFTELSDEFKDKKIISLSDTEPTMNDLVKLFKNSLLDKFKEEVAKLKKGTKKKKEKKEKKNKKKEDKKEVKKKVKDKVNKKVIKKVKIMKKVKIIKKDKKVKSLEDNHSKAVVSEKKRVDLAEAERVYQKYLRLGKIVPAQKDVLISLLTSNNKINLGDDQVGIKKMLFSLLKNQPKVVDFSEKGSQKATKKVKKVNKDEMPKDVSEFYDNLGLDEKQTEDAWKFAQKESKKADKDKSTLF